MDFIVHSTFDLSVFNIKWHIKKKNVKYKNNDLKRIMAERQGFEPWRQFPAYTRSRRAPSTTRPPLLYVSLYKNSYIRTSIENTCYSLIASDHLNHLNDNCQCSQTPYFIDHIKPNIAVFLKSNSVLILLF